VASGRLKGMFDAARAALGRQQGEFAFTCNVCGGAATAEWSAMGREDATCPHCRSSVRMRAVVHHVSMALFGRSLALPDFPERPDLRGVGLSDWLPYAQGFARKFSYTNTYYHTEPFLDITAVPDAMAGTCDVVVSTDVFEHVLPPVAAAFHGAYRLLKPGGTLVLTVPYVLEPHFASEHFPNLHDFEIEEAQCRRVLVNTTREGTQERHENLVFHGGPGNTLEMRMLHKDEVQRHLEDAGFSDVRFEEKDVPPFGIVWLYPWSLPVTARRART
jgi:SAM-dependent methyltransferase